MPDYERIEALRKILEHEQCRPFTLAEAAEIGESLTDFFKLLAEGTTGTNPTLEKPNELQLAGAA